VLLKIIALAALAVAIAVAVIIFTMPQKSNPGAANVKFTEFTPDRTDIKVGESSKIVFNVQNLENRSINSSRVIIGIEPSGYQPYLSINNPTTELPLLQGKDARTGEIEVTITATSAPAKEATYTVKGVLMAEGQQTDERDFDLKIHQQ
jgi:hypothetical protein